jgi:ParB family transcriptional regulator, chromosome partitioning protein
MSDSKKKGLGRGLSALFGDSNSDQPKETSNVEQKVALIGDINRNQFQPRIIFDENKLSELAESIKRNGVIQPIAVRNDKADPGRFEIIAGERRWLAAQRAGLHEVPIVILDLSDNEVLEVAIVENIQREDLNTIEEAKGYERLSKEFNYDQDKISKMMSKSRSHISNTLRLLTLPKDVLSMIEEGFLTAGQARPLIGLSNASKIAEEIMSRKMSAREVESLVKNKKQNIGNSKKIDADVINQQKQLEELLGLKVIINNKKNNSGKVSIEYKNLEQFELIYKLLKQN